MSYVREELGLTYGINSRVVGFDRAYDGFWQISVTLSQENLTAGIKATMDTLERFLSDGITDEELATKQRTLVGLFKVGLSTTRGLAQAMHGHFRNGYDPSYIDEYPEIISGLTVAQVNEAIRRYLHADRFVTAVAGTLQ
jgi:predicted Zn-dependent peptidase